MTEAKILKTNHRPSYWNKELAIGLMVGGPIGAALGAYIGKNKMHAENLTGKPVQTPSFWNIDAMLGGLIGSWVGVAVAAALTATITVSTGGIATVAAMAGWAASALTGLYIGGKKGHKRMSEEYHSAIPHHEAVHPALSSHHEMAHELAPDKGFALQIERERAGASPQQDR